MDRVDFDPTWHIHSSRIVKLPGRRVSIPQYHWLFTEDERTTIIDILLKGEVKEYKRTKDGFTCEVPGEARVVSKQEMSILDFMLRLEYLCEVKQEIEMLKKQKKEDLRDIHKDALAKFKGILKYLRKIEHDELVVRRDNSIDQYEDLTPMKWHSPLYMHDIIQPIEEYIKYLEELPEEPKRPGRDPADSDQFISRIAELYSEYIGKPTTYASGNDFGHRKKKPDSGRFFRLVQAVLRILDLPHEDPSRLIRAALKTYKTDPNL